MWVRLRVRVVQVVRVGGEDRSEERGGDDMRKGMNNGVRTEERKG